MSIATKILQIADTLADNAGRIPEEDLDALENASSEAQRSWSGSWLGYHSRVYYDKLEPVPPGVRFSIEWGLMEGYMSDGTVGSWAEYDARELKTEIKRRSGVKNIEKLAKTSKKIAEEFEDAQAELLSLLTPVNSEHDGDVFLSDLMGKIEKEKVHSYNDFISLFRPKGQQMSRDMTAIQAGLEIPPHYAVLAEMGSIKSAYTASANLSKWARRAASHVENMTKKEIICERVGTNVVICHGRSAAWRDLKDFVQERVHLPYDEFNRVPVAGVTNIARLSQMLDSAAIAFIVLTAEDEQRDGKLHARMNVIHEAGLFQGRLGFEKAILLLEEGCEEFSNVQGLGQIRFPKGGIGAKSEDIRQVLEREGLVK